MDKITFTAQAADAGLRLDSFLAEKAGALSRSRAKSLIKEGAVTIDGIATDDPRRAVIAGSVYALDLPAPVPAVPEPEDIPLDILFEDAHLIIINKPSGIVHRLDKLTTGVMVAAKTEAAHTGLSALFAEHDIERSYLALTRGAPRPLAGTIDEPIARATGDRKKMAVVRNPDGTHGREAITHYKALETFGLRDKGTGLPAAALIQCTLETGRTHQIRVHMSHVGASLIGDPVYGRSRGITAWGSGEGYDFAKQAARAFERQALHAAVLGFVHPITGENLRFEAPLPDDMAGLLAALRRLPGDIRD